MFHQLFPAAKGKNLPMCAVKVKEKKAGNAASAWSPPQGCGCNGREERENQPVALTAWALTFSGTQKRGLGANLADWISNSNNCSHSICWTTKQFTLEDTDSFFTARWCFPIQSETFFHKPHAI